LALGEAVGGKKVGRPNQPGKSKRGRRQEGGMVRLVGSGL